VAWGTSLLFSGVFGHARGLTLPETGAYTEPGFSMRTTTSRSVASALGVAIAIAVAVLPGPRVEAQAGARERTLFVSAVNDKGEPVEDLRVNDIIVREDGLQREVLRVSRATEPIDIALLVDNSAAADDAIVQMREALTKFVNKMAPGNQIALVTLADRPTIVVDYTSDQKRLDAGIGRLFSLSTSGMTLLDAIVEVSRGLGRRETPRAVIVPVINDGVEFSNRYHRDVIDAAMTANAPIHAVTVGSFYVNGDDAVRERSFVLDMGTKDTGGQRLTLLSPMGLDNALQKLARELSSQYKVVYGRPQSLIPPRKLELSSARNDVTVRGTPMRGQPGA
jgi:VWFA-related protein